MLRIKEIREAKNYTQDVIVKLTGIPKRSYVAYENGESDISLSKLRKIAIVLQVSISELIGETKSVESATNKNGGDFGGEIGENPKVKESPPLENNFRIALEPHSDYGRIMQKIKFADNVSISDHGAPFYDLPVSAGMVEELLHTSELPSGFISMPGVNCDAYFPITGCSFKDFIDAGDIIGVNFLNNWEILDPDCIYLIVTSDQRMLKRLVKHPTDTTLLICVSPNYREFTIDKFTIRYIMKVTFRGKPI